MLFAQSAACQQATPLTINVLPDLHLWQVEGCPDNSGAQVAAPPPKSRDGPCSAAVNAVGISIGWALGMLQALCTHEGNMGDTRICPISHSRTLKI